MAGKSKKEEIKMAEWEDRLTSPPRNTPKVHVEQFSLKTNWRLAETLLYNKGYRKDPYGIGWKRKRCDQVKTVPLGGDSEEKGDYKSGDLPWKVNCSNHILGTPALGSDKGKLSPLG